MKEMEKEDLENNSEEGLNVEIIEKKPISVKAMRTEHLLHKLATKKIIWDNSEECYKQHMQYIKTGKSQVLSDDRGKI